MSNNKDEANVEQAKWWLQAAIGALDAALYYLGSPPRVDWAAPYCDPIKGARHVD